MITVGQKDFLEQDVPIRGQAFACLSFVAPENVLRQKEPYFFSEFLAKFSADLAILFDVLSAKYPDDAEQIGGIRTNHHQIFDPAELDASYKAFVRLNSVRLEDAFHRAHDFQTSIRGLKVRGVYPNEEEARARAEKLQKTDGKHHIYVGEVGTWLPFSDNPEELRDQVYAETSLNTLMSSYLKNQEEAAEFFHQRKIVMLDDKEPVVPTFQPLMEHTNASWVPPS
jgi:hypothetical protein